MSKCLVETTGSFGLLDTVSRDYIEFNRPCVVELTSFVHGRIVLGQLRLLGSNLKEEATDQEFIEYLKESPEPENLDFAVGAFLEAFSVVEEVGAKNGEVSPVIAPETPKPATKTKE